MRHDFVEILINSTGCGILFSEPLVWTDNADWFEGIEEDSEIVMLGVWKTKPGKREQAGERGKYRFSDFTKHKLNLTLSLKAQIAPVVRMGKELNTPI
ncbi:hypothetical protein J2785_003171 [Burkholderia ambifaria]|nr:hypothetical protein [Burkholderia ambifaria]MDR6500015.1 hypothetical protein [Burkholderia ambifaria]